MHVSIGSRSWLVAWLVAVACRLALTSPSFALDEFAKDGGNEAKPRNPVKADKPGPKGQAAVPAIPPDREAAALDFARLNHPELASLLESLKQNAPREYQAALVDLNRTAERIGKLKEKSVERYEVELADWKATSRIRLLAARLTMSDDPIVEAELRSALRERLEMRLAAQRAERDRVQTRLTKLNQTIDESSAKADAIVEKQFADLRKTLPAKPGGKNKTRKPAANPADGSAKGEQQ